MPLHTRDKKPYFRSTILVDRAQQSEHVVDLSQLPSTPEKGASVPLVLVSK